MTGVDVDVEGAVASGIEVEDRRAIQLAARRTEAYVLHSLSLSSTAMKPACLSTS